MQYFYDNDPWKRLQSIHDVSDNSFAGWLGFSMTQTNTVTKDAFTWNGRKVNSTAVGSLFLNKPIVATEHLWERCDDPEYVCGRDAVRRSAWGQMMGTVLPLYSDWFTKPAGHGTGEADYRRMLAFFYTNVNYQSAQFQQLNSRVSASAGQVCSGIPNDQYLVYDQNGGDITLDLSSDPAGNTYRVTWFDPKAGGNGCQIAHNVRGGGSRTLINPFPGKPEAVVFVKHAPDSTSQTASDQRPGANACE
jgi:hypothetical protein